MSLIREHTGIGFLINLGGRAWMALITLAFLPMIASLFGAEAFGLISIFNMVMVLTGFLDLGLGTATTQKMAAYNLHRESDITEARNLLKTFETLYFFIGVIIALVLIAASWILAGHWLNHNQLSQTDIRHGLWWIALIFLFQWPQALYGGALLGLYQPNKLYLVKIVQITFQYVGGYLIARYGNPSPFVFLGWQAGVTCFSLVLLHRLAWNSIGSASTPKTGAHQSANQAMKPRFHWDLVKSNAKYFKGLTLMMFWGTLLSQADKLLISKMLPLESLGYYNIAFALANGLQYLGQPFYASVLPKLSRLYQEHQLQAAGDFYQRTCVFLAGLLMPIAFLVYYFSDAILMVWTADPVIQSNTSALLGQLALGTALNVLLLMPLALQLSREWTSLSTRTSIAFVLVYLPGMYFSIQRWGLYGAAYAWIALNLTHVFVSVPLMHRRLYKERILGWYLHAFFLPVIAAWALAALTHHIVEWENLGRFGLALLLGTTIGLNVVVMNLLLPQGRQVWTENLKKTPALFRQKFSK